MDLDTVRSMAAATPATRNRVVDFLRALAITVVVLGHWLMAAIVVRDGELVPNAVLNIASWSHPLTWIFQVMPIFFLVGGYANGLSWRSARAKGLPYAGWLRSRLRRLATPVLPLLLFWLAGISIAYAAGVPGPLLRTASQVALVPTWFLAAYVLIVAVAPPALALWERWSWWSIVAGTAVSAAVDAISISQRWILFGFVNYLVVWATVHQFGYAWLDSRLATRTHRIVLALAGLAALLLVVWPGPYPVSMIGVDGAELNNSYPTRITMLFLGMMQAGALLLLERRLTRWLQGARLWTATVFVNARIMTIYLWHLTAMILVIGISLLFGGFGLGSEPLSGAWFATRPVWYAVLIAVTAAFVIGLGRYENPVRDERPVPSAWRPIVATAAVCGGLGIMAKEGIVSDGGVSWWWPLIPVVAMVALRMTAWPRRP